VLCKFFHVTLSAFHSKTFHGKIAGAALCSENDKLMHCMGCLCPTALPLAQSKTRVIPAPTPANVDPAFNLPSAEAPFFFSKINHHLLLLIPFHIHPSI